MALSNEETFKRKAAFAAKRERLGYTQKQIAEIMGVSKRTVERWESPLYADYPLDWVFEKLDGMIQQQKETVEYAVSIAEEQTKNSGKEPEAIHLTYWLNQDEYESVHPNEGRYQQANATARAVAIVLEDLGYTVEFGFHPSLLEAIKARKLKR